MARVMSLADELTSEREQLVKAIRDIEEGEQRVRRQALLSANLAAKGLSTGEAERLLRALADALEEWIVHRGLIEGRIAYLEDLQSGN